MKQRIITGIIFGIIVLILLLFSDLGRLALLCIIPTLSLFEYFKITKAKIIDYFVFGVIMVSVSCSIYFLNVELKYFVFLSCFINILLIFNLFKVPPFIKHRKLKPIIGALYIAIPFLLAILMDLHSDKKYALISIVVLIWVSDSCAYFVGSRIGKRKLFPSISPKKTWEGFYGAGMCVFIASYIIGSIFQVQEFSYWVIFALIIWILGAFGDLIASHIKRIHIVKDSGTILPGHGGFLDRFDAFIFVTPFILLLILILS